MITNVSTIEGEEKNSFITVLSLYKFLNKKRKTQIFLNLLLTIISAILEIFSVAIILPFLTLITNPEDILNYRIMADIYRSLQIYDENGFIIFITITFIVIVVASLIIKLYNLKFTIYLGENIGADLCKDALKSILNKPYDYLISINSSDIIADINNNIAGSILAIDAFLRLISSAFLSSSIFIALLILNTGITSFTFLVLLGSYFFINKYSKSILINNSKKVVGLQPLQFKYLQESLGGIREVILSNLQDYYVSNFEKVDRKIRNYFSINGFVTNSFRFIIEALILIMICIITLSFLYLDKINSSTLAILGTFAIGTQKLLPSLQVIFRMWSNIRSKKYEILKTIKILNDQPLENKEKKIKILPFNKKIQLKDISFKYPKSKDYLFKNINLEIKKGECIGIVGESGSGKSSFADIIMTLLVPNSGQYFVDNLNIYESMDKYLTNWRSSISQVPQNIFLADTTIEENIAFGIEKKDIDYDRLNQCLKLSNLDTFVDSLPFKYKTIVGESGSFLSGGQKQRIAIARALYKGAKILVLDEATSSLDNKTEDIIIESLKAIKGKVTVLFISHRYRTLKICDKIIEIKNGEIIENKEID